MYLIKVNDRINKRWLHCSLCSEKVSYHGITTNGLSHLMKKHNLGKSERFQLEIQKALEKFQLDPIKQHALAIAVGEMIVRNMLSYNIVNKPGFINLMHKLESKFKLPFNIHLNKSIISEIYEKEK